MSNTVRLSVGTNQAAFDKVVDALSKMTKPAILPDVERDGVPVCVYETPDGKDHCAIGHLMVLDTPSKHEWARLVGSGIWSLVRGGTLQMQARESDLPVPEPYIVEPGDEVSTELLDCLQGAHDLKGNWDNHGFNNWSRMIEIADRYRLNTTAIDKARSVSSTQN